MVLEIDTTTGWTKGVVLCNYPDERWFRIHDGGACDDIEYHDVVSLKLQAPPQPPVPAPKHQRLSVSEETSFEANQGRGFGPKK